IAVHFGAQESTLHGLSGMGDLVLTSYSRVSRNRRVGERLAIPVYDVQKVGYPQRMRDFDARRRSERRAAWETDSDPE
ncbi:MAG: hypothetical protein EBU23_11840, partial [Mycobacteriaceae bacterium]|nr:hypothetical protein [Mycobacteriaceae bacterium]